VNLLKQIRWFLVAAIVMLLFALGSDSLFAQENRTRRSDNQKQSQTEPPEPATMDVIKVDSNLVSVPVIVSDREGRYIPDLTVDRFKLTDNGTEQKISYFDAAEEPVNIALLLDTSLSTEGVIDDIRKAAKNFLKDLRPQDRAMVISFDFAIHRLSDLTSDRKVLEEAIKNATVGQYFGTMLNDAVLEVTRKEFRSVTGRKAIVLLSDGQDFGSVVPGEELIHEESESDTMVYSIYYAPEFRNRDHRRSPGGFPGGNPRGGGIFGHRRPVDDELIQRQRGRNGRRRVDGAEFLRELSEVTSGRFYQSASTDLKKTFNLIAEELRHQYRLGFYPPEIQKDGSLHQLRVKVDANDVAVRSRQQYRAQ